LIAYGLHPEVRGELDKIWDFIAKESFDAGDKVIGDLLGRMNATT
jgi:hypothetical protein